MAQTTTTTTEKKAILGKVLVIGGNGFLGHHIVKLLFSSWSATVAVIDLKCERNRLDGAQYFEADITNADAVKAVFDQFRPDIVNVEGTKVIVDACLHAGVKVLVYTSSASILSDNKTDLRNANENFPVIRAPTRPTEDIVLKANRTGEHNLLTAAIRPAGIFGEGDGMTTKHMVQIYVDGRTNVQVGDNNNLFDFTYVGNVAHAHLLAALRLLATYRLHPTVPLDTERVDGEAFLVTNDSPMYFWDFARTMWRAAGRDAGLEGVWKLPVDVGILLGFLSERIVYSSMTRYYNINKAKERLGYRPIVSLEEGVNRAVQWCLEDNKQLGAAAAARKKQQ
ncbi:unnamed protein product [Parascedosporium putredinis]|uniref:3-beta hydroxysteroid dehydrogenase/isomerase domain-containing protein n=1 Tax=Parascedosporium putredinis TaxID=1442378 RepID=A0A9P1H669_9PEZI|nr:unnamed protein product [Parascedosporium putredinis]CAI7998580.1 unnamed protein product [Parascedosporium putredinis]